MGKHCCATHINDAKKRDALFARNAILLGLGLLLQVHEIEHLLFNGFAAAPVFASLTLFIVYVLINDFEHIAFKKHLLRLIAMIGGLLAVKLILNISLLLALNCLLSISTLSKVYKLAKDIMAEQRSTILQNIKSSFNKFCEMTWVPSMEAIILASISITWGASALVLFHPLITGEILIHDAMMQLSVYNLGRWLRSYFDSSAFFHNHTTRVKIALHTDKNDPSKTKYVSRPINQLKAGDVIVIDEEHQNSGVYIPVEVDVLEGTAVYRDCQQEQKVRCYVDSAAQRINLAAHHKVYLGTYLCKQDYVSHRSKENKKLRQEHTLKDDLGIRVFLFVMYLTAIASSLTTAWHVGLIYGVEKLCLTLMVACPCVYMVIGPATLSKITKLVPRLSFLMCTESLPLMNNRKTVVFDRTGTLWHEDPKSKDPNAPYIISDESKTMLKKLINKGIDIKILSGHSTGNWEKNLSMTKNLLRRLGVKDVDNAVIFDRSLHGGESLKGEYIRNLKKYDFYGLKPSWKQKLLGRLYNFWSPHSVIMVGDDINDQSAMQAADISVAVGSIKPNKDGSIDNKRSVAYNDAIETYAHFLTNKESVHKLYKVIAALERSSLWIRALTLTSALFGVGLMSVVSGIIHIQMSINPAFLCLFTTSYCFAVTLLSQSRVLDNILERSIKEPSGHSPTESILTAIKKKLYKTAARLRKVLDDYVNTNPKKNSLKVQQDDSSDSEMSSDNFSRTTRSTNKKLEVESTGLYHLDDFCSAFKKKRTPSKKAVRL